MSTVAGIDFDSEAIYIAEVDEDTGAFVAIYRRELYATNGAPDTSFERARRARDAMPARALWHDAGIVAVGIEDPFSRHAPAIKAEARVQGAILACLPAELPVYPLQPHTRDGWKGRTVGKANASKEAIAEWALANGAPPGLRQDFYDAFCIGRATRELLIAKAAAA